MTDQTSIPLPPTTPVVNPLIERARMPGETFTLPSQGLLYHHGELDGTVVNGEVYVYPMVTLDEIIMRTPDKLYSGEGIRDVFKRCVPQVRDPLELFAKDVDFLMVCLRKITYGEFMDIEHTHTCEGAKSHSYSIAIDPFIRKAKKMDPTKTEKDFSVTLENGQVVKLLPPRLKTILQIYQVTSSGEADAKEVGAKLLDMISDMIESVDGITDSRMIHEWVRAIKAGWVNKIKTKLDSLGDWGPTFKSKVKCQDCGVEYSIDTPINPIAFFT